MFLLAREAPIKTLLLECVEIVINLVQPVQVPPKPNVLPALLIILSHLAENAFINVIMEPPLLL